LSQLVFAIMAQKNGTEKREETEKKEERKLIEKEWHLTVAEVLLSGLDMIMEKFNEEKDCPSFEQRRKELDRVYKAKNDYDEKKDGGALEEVVDHAKTALNQLVETRGVRLFKGGRRKLDFRGD
ncbi:hypothetical protein PENTCL1PPCAC_19209, partial [Pristionchus entomophagus]